MKISKESTFGYHEYSTVKELADSDRELVERACQALDSSYSPYSKFSVGAAVLLENGVVVQGSNQENGAYPSGLCAERVALFAAGAQHPGIAVRAIAITARFNGKIITEPISPCGACRQVMMEYRTIGQKPLKVLLAGREKVYEIDDAAFLLPFNFSNIVDAVK